MLESRRLFIAPADCAGSPITRYELCDADSGEVVGSAIEQVSGFIRVLRRVIGRRLLPTTVEVTEKPDDSLVFTLRQGAGLFRPQAIVWDSLGQPVGRIRGGVVYDREWKRLSRLDVGPGGANCRFVTVGGEELGRVTTEDGKAVLEVSAELAGEPIAKMLLLAAALSGLVPTRRSLGQAE